MAPRVEALFPGYLFVELDPHHESTAPIRSTRGAVGLVRFGDQPCAIPEPVIAGLRYAEPGADQPIDPTTLLKPGDRVTIIDGPLAGLTAIFKARTAAERICLLFDLLGRPNECTVAPYQVSLALSG